MSTPSSNNNNGDEPKYPPPSSSDGFLQRAEKKWLEMKENVEAYPYVWASYALVYGGLSAYLAWRWRKLRRTEDRVRVLSARLRELGDLEQSVAKSKLPNPGKDDGKL